MSTAQSNDHGRKHETGNEIIHSGDLTPGPLRKHGVGTAPLPAWRFPALSAFSHLASDTFMTPYFFRHLQKVASLIPHLQYGSAAESRPRFSLTMPMI